MSHKEAIHTFLTMIIVGDIQTAFDQFASPLLVHHNQYTKPGITELIKGMQGNHEHFPHKLFDIEMILEEGDRVMTYSLMRFTPEHAGLRVVHIFRFEDEKIREMRDVVMEVKEDAVNK